MSFNKPQNHTHTTRNQSLKTAEHAAQKAEAEIEKIKEEIKDELQHNNRSK